MSILPSTKNLKLAEELVAEINAQIQSSHQICNRIHEMPPTAPWQMESRINQKMSWDRLIRFLDFDTHKERIRDAVYKISQESSAGETRMFLAAAKFGKGDCAEMATVAQMKAARLAHTMLVYSGSTPDRDSVAYNHCFVVLLPSLEDGKKIVDRGLNDQKLTGVMDLTGFLKNLPKEAIILDPYLKVACKASDLFVKQSDLLEYNRVWNLKYIWDLRVLGRQSPNLDKIEKGVEELYQRAKEILPSMVPSGGCASILTEIATEARKILAQVFPDTQWKSNKGNGLRIFFTGTKEKAEEISHKLQQNGIQLTKSQVRNQTDFCIVIQNPDLFQLRALLKCHGEEVKS